MTIQRQLGGVTNPLYIVGLDGEDHVSGFKVTTREFDFESGTTLSRFLRAKGLGHIHSASRAGEELANKLNMPIFLVHLTQSNTVANIVCYLPGAKKMHWDGTLYSVPDELTRDPQRRKHIEFMADMRRFYKRMGRDENGNLLPKPDEASVERSFSADDVASVELPNESEEEEASRQGLKKGFTTLAIFLMLAACAALVFAWVYFLP